MAANQGYSSVSANLNLGAPTPQSPKHVGKQFLQVVNHAKLYMTHYAFFEEVDPNVPGAIYFDAATNLPTAELFLLPPVNARLFTREGGSYLAPSETSKFLPYFVSPPGFPPQPAPAQLVSFIQLVTGQPQNVVQANTNVLLVAIGQFVGSGQSTNATVSGGHFSIDKLVEFQVRIRIGFLFTPPPGVIAPSVGVLVGYLDFGTLHQLIGLPPPPNPTELVVYDWQAQMTLSTRNSYVRNTATEPPPVADPFDPAMKQISFVGSDIDHDGHYTIVGSARPADVTFQAPPELVEFLFQVPALTDVEFAVQESGILIPI